MKTILNYVVADDTTIYAETNTRQQARNYLRSVKAKGKKFAKIYKEEYALIQIDQVR